MGAKGDDIDGVMLLDKPAGMSSNWALQLTRRLINAKKAGHTGTLDPMASGCRLRSETPRSIPQTCCTPTSAMRLSSRSAQPPIRWIKPVR